jgi:hypothetical protein
MFPRNGSPRGPGGRIACGVGVDAIVLLIVCGGVGEGKLADVRERNAGPRNVKRRERNARNGVR